MMGGGGSGFFSLEALETNATAVTTAHTALNVYVSHITFPHKHMQNHFYLQSGSVHVSRQLSAATAGYHEHFIWIYLQKRHL